MLGDAMAYELTSQFPDTLIRSSRYNARVGEAPAWTGHAIVKVSNDELSLSWLVTPQIVAWHQSFYVETVPCLRGQLQCPRIIRI